VRAVSSERVGQVMKDLHITPQADLDAPTIGRIANQSNVDTVVSGSYAQLGDRIRIDAKIQDLKRGQSVTVKEEAAGDKEIFRCCRPPSRPDSRKSARIEKPAEGTPGTRL